MDVQRLGIVGSGQMGAGHRRGGGQGGLRGRVALPNGAMRRRPCSPASTSRWPSRSARASLEDAEREAIVGPDHAHDRAGRLVSTAIWSSSRWSRTSPSRRCCSSSSTQIVQAQRHRGHQHLDAAGDRAGDADEATGAGVRHPLLQPGAADVAGGGGAAPHRHRRDHRRRQGLRASAVARTPSR